MVNVGGFWSSLKLVTDKPSFDRGMKSLNVVKSTVKGLTSFAVKSIAGLFAYTGIMSIFEGRHLRLANALQISSIELSAWKSVASMAGIGADELANSMLNLEKKAQRLKLGEVDLGLAKALGMLGVKFGEFNKAKSDVRMKMVISQAMKMEDKGKAAELVRDTLGDAGVELFRYMQLSGQSLDSMLGKARALTFTNERTKKTAMIFNQELKSTIGGVKEIGNLFASSFAVNFIPVLRGIQNLIIKNKQLISVNVIKYGKELGKVFASIFQFVAKGVPYVVKLIDKMGGLESVIKKIGIAFGIFMGAKLLGGLGDLGKGIGGIVTLFKGLIMVAADPKLLLLSASLIALFLIIEDIYSYTQGKKSITGEVIKSLANITKELQDSFDMLKASFGYGTETEKTRVKAINKLTTMSLQQMTVNEKLGKGAFKRAEAIKEYVGTLSEEELGKIIAFKGKKDELKITVETKGDRDVITGVEFNGETIMTGKNLKDASKNLQQDTGLK